MAENCEDFVGFPGDRLSYFMTELYLGAAGRMELTDFCSLSVKTL